MTETHRVEFEILGQTYAIRSAASPEYVRSLVAYLDQKLKEAGGEGVQDPAKRLALAALYITDELFRLKADQTGVDNATARVDALLRLLDEAAKDPLDDRPGRG